MSEPFEHLLNIYVEWVKEFSDRLQRVPVKDISYVIVQSGEDTKNQFSEFPHFYAQITQDTIYLHEDHSALFPLILQFHAILHFLPPEYRQNELLRTIIFLVLFFHNFKKNSKVPGFENVFAKFREYVLGKVKNYIPAYIIKLFVIN